MARRLLAYERVIGNRPPDESSPSRHSRRCYAYRDGAVFDITVQERHGFLPQDESSPRRISQTVDYQSHSFDSKATLNLAYSVLHRFYAVY